jgi:UDP-glucose 4-epimerase
MSPSADMPGTALAALAARFAGERVLVTGGAGFIGGHLAAALLAGGAEVRVLDDLSTGRKSNIPRGAEFRLGDVADPRVASDAVEGCARVVHLAAMVSVPQSVLEPAECRRVNVGGTEAVVAASLRHGAGSLVLASTCAVYGVEPARPSRETDPLVPASPYAASKIEAEAVVRAAAERGTHASSLRFFNVYGPRQDPRGAYAAAISAFVDAALAGRAQVVHGDGLQSRDFVSVDDVVQAVLRALDPARRAAGGVLNVGTGVETTILDAARATMRAAGRGDEPGHGPVRAGDVRHSCADIALARSAIGYEPRVGFEEGIGRLVASMSA